VCFSEGLAFYKKYAKGDSETIALDPWSIDYFEDKFAKPDPWKYFTTIYERTKYQRQLDIIKDRNPNPQSILEIGSAEGAQTLLLADQFPEANITAIGYPRMLWEGPRITCCSSRIELS
jgi:hypothetical protein